MKCRWNCTSLKQSEKTKHLCNGGATQRAPQSLDYLVSAPPAETTVTARYQRNVRVLRCDQTHCAAVDHWWRLQACSWRRWCRPPLQHCCRRRQSVPLLLLLLLLTRPPSRRRHRRLYWCPLVDTDCQHGRRCCDSQPVGTASGCMRGCRNVRCMSLCACHWPGTIACA